MKRLVACSAAAAASCLLVSGAAAHVDLVSPESRYGNGTRTPQKAPPCGEAENSPVDEIRTTFAPGETITVTIEETIYHDGYFRIAFDDEGDDDFVPPQNGNDTYNSPQVLLDHILIAPSEERPADTKGTYEIEVTLPDVECENCTLQLIQAMTSDLNAPLNPAAGGNLYYRCANLRLVAGGADAGPDESEPDAGADPDPDPSGPDAGNSSNPATGEPVGGGCAVSNAQGVSGMLLLGLALLALRRRRVS